MESTSRARLGNYNLIRTLGKGAFSKVKLAQSTTDGNHVAIKIHKTSNPEFNQSAVNVIENEARAVSKLEHPGIVNILDYIPRSEIVKPNAAPTEVVCVIVNEIADGGELFYYVKNSGPFEERYARRIYREMLSALKYVHDAGLAHRDIKPDNILLDKNFNIKIADFGFAGPIAGRDNQGGYLAGYLTTQLGTVPYQAPEINDNKPYKGTEVDLFALNIVLFILVSGLPPFREAKGDDFYYNLIKSGRPQDFWRYHTQDRQNGGDFFSAEFRDFIWKAFQYSPQHRMSTLDIETHPWFNGPVVSNEEYLAEMRRRKEINDIRSQQERAQRQQAAQRTRVINQDRRRGAGGAEDEDEKLPEVEKFVLKKEGAMKAYDAETMSQDIGFVLCENPDTLVDVITDYLEAKQGEEEVKCEVDDKKYKLSIQFEGKALNLDIKIYRIGEADEFFLQFVKTKGYLEDMLEFKSELEKHINQEFGYAEAGEGEQEEDQ